MGSVPSTEFNVFGDIGPVYWTCIKRLLQSVFIVSA